MNFSWIEEEERLLHLKENSKRENIQTLELVSIYINQKEEIETVERETMDITETNNNISRDQIIEWRDQRIKYTPNSKFILKDILFFHVPIEPENIPDIKSETKAFMTNYSNIAIDISSSRSSNNNHKEVALDAIPIPPAIFIFHSLTTLFFLFHEIPNTMESVSSRIKTIQKKTKKTVKIHVSKPNSSTHSTNQRSVSTNLRSDPSRESKKIRITRKQYRETETET